MIATTTIKEVSIKIKASMTLKLACIMIEIRIAKGYRFLKAQIIKIHFQVRFQLELEIKVG